LERAEVVQAAIETVTSLAGEWEYSGALSADTRLIADLAMRSLDIVVLSSSMVRKYGLIPFNQLYADLEGMPPEDRDITIGQFADFVVQHAAPRSAAASETPSSRTVNAES
jgi:acyl carrier protein